MGFGLLTELDTRIEPRSDKAISALCISYSLRQDPEAVPRRGSIFSGEVFLASKEVGVMTIGRNEGKRLIACLISLKLEDSSNVAYNRFWFRRRKCSCC